jgi:hypothetical protein
MRQKGMCWIKVRGMRPAGNAACARQNAKVFGCSALRCRGGVTGVEVWDGRARGGEGMMAKRDVWDRYSGNEASRECGYAMQFAKVFGGSALRCL